jgi:hypothetical protein
MAWRKQPPPTRARTDAGTGVRGDGLSDEPEQLLDFSRGLYPILVQADTAAFRQYLSAWEDVIGDTTELTATPADQLRRTMAAVLRRPQQFGLPAWPATGVLDGAGVTGAPPPATPPAAPIRPAEATRPPPAPAPAVPATPAVPAAPVTPAAPAGGDDPQGVYQLDMLTGEFVPIPAPTGAVAEPAPAPYDAGAEAPAAPAHARRRRRRRTTGLEQLSLWPVAG